MLDLTEPRCTNCQTVINGLPFEAPQGSLCTPCRVLSLRGKNHPWLAFLTDVVVWLAMFAILLAMGEISIV